MALRRALRVEDLVFTAKPPCLYHVVTLSVWLESYDSLTQHRRGMKSCGRSCTSCISVTVYICPFDVVARCTIMGSTSTTHTSCTLYTLPSDSQSSSHVADVPAQSCTMSIAC